MSINNLFNKAQVTARKIMRNKGNTLLVTVYEPYERDDGIRVSVRDTLFGGENTFTDYVQFITIFSGNV